jgi:hypothetical protein
VAPVLAGAEEHLFVISPQGNESSRLLAAQEPLHNRERIWPAVDVVAQSNQAIVRLDGDHIHQRPQGREAAMNIAQRKRSHGKMNSGKLNKRLSKCTI